MRDELMTVHLILSIALEIAMVFMLMYMALKLQGVKRIKVKLADLTREVKYRLKENSVTDDEDEATADAMVLSELVHEWQIIKLKLKRSEAKPYDDMPLDVLESRPFLLESLSVVWDKIQLHCADKEVEDPAEMLRKVTLKYSNFTNAPGIRLYTMDDLDS